MPRTLAQNAQYINETIKPAIKSAIEAQGVTVPSTDSFLDYADRIGEIEGGGSGYQLKDLPSGSISTVNDAAPLPLNALKVSVEAQQDLHGYDYPWVGGAGKNKAEADNFSTDSYDGTTFNNVAEGGKILENTTLPAGDYVFSIKLLSVPSTIRTISCVNNDDTSVVFANFNNLKTLNVGQVYSQTFTLSERVILNTRLWGSGGGAFKIQMQIESGSQATSYEPYSNICPISGWDSGEISVVGKNLCPVSEGDFLTVATWVSLSNENANTFTNGTMLKLKAGTYTLSLSNTQNLNALQIFDEGGDTIANTSSSLVTFALNSAETLYIRLRRYSSSANLIFKIQIELGNRATTFESYQGNQYTQQFPQKIYGAEWDVVNGQLKVTDGYIASYNGETLPSTWISDRDEYASGTTPTIGAEVVYKLATPTTIDLSPLSIRLLEGTNNLYADCGEVIEGEYFSGSAKGYVDGIKYAGEGDGGIASYMNVKSADELLGATAITFEVYARIDSYVNKTSGAYARLMEFGNSQQSGRLGFVGLASDNDNNLCYWDDTADVALGIDTWTLGDTHLISVVKTTAGDLKIYIDGVLKYTGSSTLTITTSIIDYVTERGGYSSQVDSARQLNGEVYAWRVYAKELSAANIAQNLAADRSLYSR